MITRIGLGGWAIGGGDWVCGWGPQKDAESVAAIRRAVESGINWIDTAGVYGLGRSERVIARALREMPARERPGVFTKCGLVWDELGNVSHSLEPGAIRRELEASLRRLEVEVIDLFQIGWPARPGGSSGHEPDSLERAWETMAALQHEGRVRFIGVSGCDADQLARLLRIAPVTSLQLPHSLLQRGIDARTVSLCARHDIGVIAHSPLQSGLLAGAMTPGSIDALPHNDWRRRSPCFHEPLLGQALRLVGVLRAVGARHGRTPGEVAIAWTLRDPAVTAALAGSRRPAQVAGLVGAASFRLTEQDVDDLEHACRPAGAF